MKTIIITILLLLIAGQAWGATYYIDPSCGQAGGTGATSQCDGGADDVRLN